MVDAGIPLLSQTVLLRGVNDNAQVLGSLMRALVECRIKPYYLHHGDLAPGTAHWRTSIARGQSLMRALRGRYSGLCQPAYVLDIPGGHGKVPVGPNYLSGDEEAGYRVEDFRGQRHDYALPHALETRVSPGSAIMNRSTSLMSTEGEGRRDETTQSRGGGHFRSHPPDLATGDRALPVRHGDIPEVDQCW
jgi:hypothetical protein